jgi:ribosomal protein S18 acetylase RimI-like enzyme
MPSLEIVAFADEHVDTAAELLAGRHRRHRSAEPLLPAKVDFRDEVEAMWRREGASGAVAFEGGAALGFLIGAPREDPIWGPNVWVDPAGHAVEAPEAARDLYAAAAGRWVEEGRTRHYAVVPSSDAALLEAWSRLGFGQQHAFAIRELAEETTWPEGVREATERDMDALVALEPVLPDHQSRAPVFGPVRPPEPEAELRESNRETIASEDAAYLVSESDGGLAGAFLVTPVERSSMHAGLARPENAALLAWAAIPPDARGRGTGLALTRASFAWARARGYAAIVTDWRVTNLLASRFWPRRGFRPTFLRLYRHIP